jgi:polysaccharide chain length determinant protein (PEP-CTERM system associated)
MLPNRSFTPTTILEIVRRRLGLLVIPPALGLFAALLYSSTISNLYQSDMLIAIIPQRVPDSVVRSTVTLRVDERLDELIVVVMSRTSLEQMITELDLYPKERQTLPMNDVVALMRGDLEVGLEPMRRGPRGPEPPNAFHVRFTYSDPKVAAVVTQKIGSMFVEQNTKGRSALALATNAFLKSELDLARQRLEEQERRLEEFRERHGKELPTQLQTNMEAARGLQMQVQALVESIARDRDRKMMLERLYREASTEAPVNAASAPMPDAVAGVTSSGSLQRQLQTARVTLSALETKYTEDHPDVVRMKSQIAEIERRIEDEASRTPGSVAAPVAEVLDPLEAQRRESLRQMLAEIESLDRQTAFKEKEERRLRTEIEEYQRAIQAVPGTESEWVKLSRDYDTIQTAYRELLTKSEAAKMAINLEEREIGEQFRIVDAAQVPVHPLRSIRGMVNAGGLVLGLLSALGVAAFLELRDKSYRTDTDVLDVLALPVLAAVPRIVDAAERTRIRQRKLLLSAIGIVCLVSAGYLAWTLRLWNSVL